MRKLRKVVPFGLAVMMSLQGIYPAVPVMADTVKVAATKKSTSSATVLSKKERAKIMQQINAMSPEEGLKLAKKKGIIKEDTNAKESNLKKATVNKDAKEGEVGYQFTQDQYVDETHRIRYEYIITAEGEVSADYIMGIYYKDGKPETDRVGADKSYIVEDELTYPTSVTLNGTTYKVKIALNSYVKAKHLIIPEGIEEVSVSSSDDHIEKMTIPSTTKKIRGTGFYGVYTNTDKTEIDWKKKQVFKGYELTNPEKAKYITVKDGIIYNKDETELLARIPACLEKDTVILPDTLQKIPSGAFQSCVTVKKVIFGKNITSIGNGAFAYSNIENVQMNDNVTALDEYAFYYCTKLADVDLSKSLTKIDGYKTFKYTAALKHIDLKNVKELTGWYTFQQSGLEDVDLSNVESVDGVQVFGSCYDMKTVYIGKNTDLSSRLGIGCNCFVGCHRLEKYVQKEANKNNLYVEDGKLYASKITGYVALPDGDMAVKTLTGKILLGYPVQMQRKDSKNNNKTLKLDDDITGIGCAGLTTFAQYIEDDDSITTDEYCNKLIIPSSIKSIELVYTMPEQDLEIDIYGNEIPAIDRHCFYSVNSKSAEKEDAVLGTKTIKFKTAALRDEFVEHWKEHVMYIYKGEKEVYDVLPEKKTISITLNRTSDTFKCEGEPQEIHLIAKLSSDDCTDVVKFTSSNEKVATVDGNGVVKTIAGAHGTAIITATAGDYSASYKVTVKGSGIHATGLNGSDLGSFKWDDEYGKNQLDLSDIHIYCNDCNKGLEKGTDYTVSYENTDKPGKAKVTFTGINGYKGYSLSYTYTILPNSFTIDESLPACRWKGTGKEHKVDLTGKVTHWNPYKGEKTTLVEGKDYRLEYSDNTEIGIAKVKVIGLGDYEGYEKILSFEIKAPHGWNGFQVNYNGDVYKDGDDLGSFDWTGNDVEPKFEVTCNHCGDTLANGTDYYLEYSNDHRDPGKVTVKVVGFGDYKGWTQSFTYTIKNKTFSFEDHKDGEDLGTVEYTGSEVRYPISNVTDKTGKTLSEGTDYKLVYSDNTKPGVANVQIIGLNDYDGCNLNFTYTIDHAYFMYNGYGVNNDGADLGTVAYTGKATEYEISDVYDSNDWNNKLIEGKDYKLVYSDNTKPGTAKVEIIGSGIYTGCDLTFTYTIVDRDAMSGFSSNLYADGSDIGSFAYTGEEVKPSLGLIYGNQSQSFLVEGTDYKIEYSNNVNPGTATAKVIGIGRFAGKELTFTYTIKNKSFASKDHKDGENLGTLKWTGKEQKMDVGSFYDATDGHTLVENKDYKLVYSDNKDAGTAKVRVIGLGYYDGSELSFTYTIEKQHGWNGFYSKGHKDGESLGTYKWTGNSILIDPDMRCSHCDKELQENVDYKIEYSNNIDPGVASMKIIGMGDYKGYELNFTFVIEKKTPTTTEDQKPTTTTTETKPTTGTTESSSATSETKPTTVTTASTTTTTTESKPTTEDKTTATTESKPTTSSTTTETKPATTETRPSTEDSSTSGTTAAKKETATTAAPVIRISVKKAAIQKIKALKKAFTINILKNKDQVTGYQISYSYKKNFKGQKVKDLKKFKYKKIKVKRKKYTITSYKVKGLKRKKTVYVRVRAYKQVGKTKVYGKWSSVKKVKIK